MTANTCFGSKAKVREAVGAFFRTLPDRAEAVMRRCRRVLQDQADVLASVATALCQDPQHGDLTVALV